MKLRMRLLSRPSGKQLGETRCGACNAQVTEVLAGSCWQCGQTWTFDDWHQARRAAESAAARSRVKA